MNFEMPLIASIASAVGAAILCLNYYYWFVLTPEQRREESSEEDRWESGF